MFTLKFENYQDFKLKSDMISEVFLKHKKLITDILNENKISYKEDDFGLYLNLRTAVNMNVLEKLNPANSYLCCSLMNLGVTKEN